jgi:SAM-dependent methyltransferase
MSVYTFLSRDRDASLLAGDFIVLTDATTMPHAAPAAVVPNLLRSPGGAEPLHLDGDRLVDPAGALMGRKVGPVWSFLDEPDAFYEGKYNNRIRFVPKGDGFLATLPLRVVSQSFPTTVAAEVPKGGAVVEIGCAAGVAWFGRRFRMIGLDLSQKALEIASEDYELVLQADGTRMPLADGSVDAVISSCLFEHLTVDQKRTLLTECMRVLKPGGKVVFLYDLWTDNPVIAHYRAKDPARYQRMFLDGDGHLGYASVDENRFHFRAVGLRIDREIFHERTLVLTNSVWKKFSDWPGWRGTLGQIGAALTSGMLRLPAQALVSATDATFGRLFPKRFARGMITVASKP